tara:strand:+ start:791 stop:1204 length:414 start_codon:yes stop_codon:yes gene_type:complete
MFSNNNNMKNTTNNSSAINMVGTGTVINGDIVSKSDIRIDGILKGSVRTKGKLVVGSSGVVDGDVECENADVSGEINAKITVSQLLSLKSTSKLNGDIVTNKLSIEPGASFSGSCSMGAVIKDIKHVEKQEKKEKTA